METIKQYPAESVFDIAELTPFLQQAIHNAYIAGLEAGYWRDAMLSVSTEHNIIALYPDTLTSDVADQDFVYIYKDGTHSPIQYKPILD